MMARIYEDQRAAVTEMIPAAIRTIYVFRHRGDQAQRARYWHVTIPLNVGAGDEAGVSV